MSFDLFLSCEDLSWGLVDVVFCVLKSGALLVGGAPVSQSLVEYKEKVLSLIEEYFASGDFASMATD